MNKFRAGSLSTIFVSIMKSKYPCIAFRLSGAVKVLESIAILIICFITSSPLGVSIL